MLNAGLCHGAMHQNVFNYNRKVEFIVGHKDSKSFEPLFDHPSWFATSLQLQSFLSSGDLRWP